MRFLRIDSSTDHTPPPPAYLQDEREEPKRERKGVVFEDMIGQQHQEWKSLV